MPPLKLQLAVTLVFLWGNTAESLDPSRATSQYVVTRWGARDLSSGSVHALLQTTDGYLWLGTTDGPVRFDGARFVSFADQGVAGLHDVGGVSSLGEGGDGTLYLGTSVGGVVSYREGRFTELPVPQGNGAVHALLPRPDGSLWVLAHARQLYQLKDGKVGLKKYHFPNGTRDNIDAPLSAAAEANGNVWIGSAWAGLLELAGDQATPHGFARETVQALHRDRSGALWMGTPHGLLQMKDGAIRTFTVKDGLSHDFVTAILEDRAGSLWIGTAGGGLNRFADGRFSHFTTREGLSNDYVHCLLEDREGNLWVGTMDGLDCLSDGPFITYGGLEGLVDPMVTAVAAMRDGTIWLGTNSAGLARLRGDTLERFSLPAGVGRDAIISLQESRDGGLWVVADNGRVFLLKDGRILERTPDVDPSKKVRLVIEDEEGPIFFIPGPGLMRERGRSLVPILTGESCSVTGYVHAAYRDPDGVLWVGTSRGLVEIRKGECRLMRQEEGLPHTRVRALAGETGGGLWLATLGGLGYLEHGVCRSLTTAQGLPENYLRAVLDDGRGYLWIASMSRIFRLDKREVQDVLAARKARVSPVVFDKWDGLRTTEPAALTNSPAARAPDGRVWFATAQGASVVDPALVSADDPAPRARLERIRVDDQVGIAAEYPPGRGEVTIDYTTLAFRSPAKVSFRHRLEGLDRDWVDASARRTAYYSNLPPGRYTFSVMASNREGRWNGTAASHTFVIRPPFYRTGLFYALCAAVLVGLTAGAHRLRLRAMHMRLTAIISERTRIARELHDTLAQGLAGVGLQLHTVATLLPHEASVDGARKQLEQAHGMIRTSLTEVRRSIWVLRAQTAKDAKDLVSSLEESLAQLATESKTLARFEVSGTPRTLSSDLERNLLRIAHEAVCNALRHAHAERVTIGLHFEKEHVRLLVSDDGTGFDVAAALHTTTEHFGLVGIAERTRALGGEISVTSARGAGASVECRLPYNHPEEGLVMSQDGAEL
jgi:ligand-binding sensor domain-containing protein/signal transduction histidine kinase